MSAQNGAEAFTSPARPSSAAIVRYKTSCDMRRTGAGSRSANKACATPTEHSGVIVARSRAQCDMRWPGLCAPRAWSAHARPHRSLQCGRSATKGALRYNYRLWPALSIPLFCCCGINESEDSRRSDLLRLAYRSLCCGGRLFPLVLPAEFRVESCWSTTDWLRLGPVGCMLNGFRYVGDMA